MNKKMITDYDYAKQLIAIYESLYLIKLEIDNGTILSFQECLDMIEIEYLCTEYEYNKEYQWGRYIIPFKKVYFVIVVESKHEDRINWSIENG